MQSKSITWRRFYRRVFVFRAELPPRGTKATIAITRELRTASFERLGKWFM
jgi:hypothetical protein